MTGIPTVRPDRLLRALLRARDGYSALEFAFVAPIFVVLIAGAAELGNYAVEHIRLAGAAKAGAHYGLQDQSTAADAAGIEQAVREDAGDDAAQQLVVASERFCRCPGASDKTDCTGECPDDEYVPMYLNVSVTNQHNALFPFMSIPMLANVSASTEVRLR